MTVKKNPDNEVIKTTYKRYWNFCNNLLKKLKKEYEKDQIELNKFNNKNYGQR